MVQLLELDERFVVPGVDGEDLLEGDPRSVRITGLIAPECRDLAKLVDLFTGVAQRIRPRILTSMTSVHRSSPR
jgi:hypothetical protein